MKPELVLLERRLRIKYCEDFADDRKPLITVRAAIISERMVEPLGSNYCGGKIWPINETTAASFSEQMLGRCALRDERAKSKWEVQSMPIISHNFSSSISCQKMFSFLLLLRRTELGPCNGKVLSCGLPLPISLRQ